MKLEDIKKKQIPDSPGVYMFWGLNKKPLYIGKATSLHSRVRSYFDKDIPETRGQHIASMVKQSRGIDFIETDSVLEAIILEVNLIKKHKPKYNTKEKDDKSFNYVVITKEDFPRILLVRERELLGDMSSKLKYDIKYGFGPFPQGSTLREALRIIRKIFPFRDRCTPDSSKPCFNRQINLCPGICSNEISKKEYSKTIRNLKLFFEGKKKKVIDILEKDMGDAAKNMEFEQAEQIKKTIFALNHIRDVALIKDTGNGVSNFRIEAYDVAHISGKFIVGVMTVIENSEPNINEYRKFKIRSFEGVNDTRALKETVERRLTHPEWQLPKLFVVDGGKAQKNIVEKTLKEAGVIIPVVGVVKDERHKPKNVIGKRGLIEKHEKEILLANSEAHRFAIKYHKQLRSKEMLGK